MAYYVKWVQKSDHFLLLTSPPTYRYTLHDIPPIGRHVFFSYIGLYAT